MASSQSLGQCSPLLRWPLLGSLVWLVVLWQMVNLLVLEVLASYGDHLCDTLEVIHVLCVGALVVRMMQCTLVLLCG